MDKKQIRLDNKKTFTLESLLIIPISDNKINSKTKSNPVNKYSPK